MCGELGARGHVHHKLDFSPSVCTCSRRFSENLLLWEPCACDGPFVETIGSQPSYSSTRELQGLGFQIWSELVNIWDGLGFTLISDMVMLSINCKAPIALSSRLAGGAFLRNAPVSKPGTLVGAPRSRKRAAESYIYSISWREFEGN